MIEIIAYILVFVFRVWGVNDAKICTNPETMMQCTTQPFDPAYYSNW